MWWVRHGPVAHGGRIYGQTDLACDCPETALFTGLAEKLPRNAVWVTSNLRRTQETAAAIACAGLRGSRPISGLEAMPELAEQDFGVALDYVCRCDPPSALPSPRTITCLSRTRLRDRGKLPIIEPGQRGIK